MSSFLSLHALCMVVLISGCDISISTYRTWPIKLYSVPGNFFIFLYDCGRFAGLDRGVDGRGKDVDGSGLSSDRSRDRWGDSRQGDRWEK